MFSFASKLEDINERENEVRINKKYLNFVNSATSSYVDGNKYQNPSLDMKNSLNIKTSKENVHPDGQTGRKTNTKRKYSGKWKGFGKVALCSERLNDILEEIEDPKLLPVSPRICFNLFQNSDCEDEFFLLPLEIRNLAELRQLSTELVELSETEKKQFDICREVVGLDNGGAVWLYKGEVWNIVGIDRLQIFQLFQTN